MTQGARMDSNDIFTSGRFFKRGIYYMNITFRDTNGSDCYQTGCTENGICCGGVCDPAGSTCCGQDLTDYCSAGTQCCDVGCCQDGQVCCQWGCGPAGVVCCNTGYCPAGSYCWNGYSELVSLYISGRIPLNLRMNYCAYTQNHLNSNSQESATSAAFVDLNYDPVIIIVQLSALRRLPSRRYGFWIVLLVLFLAECSWS